MTLAEIKKALPARTLATLVVGAAVALGFLVVFLVPEYQNNAALADNPALVNSDPFGDGWFFKIRIADPAELDGLMDEAAYAEFVFQEVLWPDYGAEHLAEAVAAYIRRERRYGARP